MSNQLRIIVAQADTYLGDIAGNTTKVVRLAKQAAACGADIIVFPELFLLGYPPEDVLYRPELTDKLAVAQRELAHASQIHGIAIVVGSVDRHNNHLYNSAWFFTNGRLDASYHKHALPNYGVFDEHRYFTEGKDETIIHIGNTRIMLLVCEDIWTKNARERVIAQQPDLVIVINASPFEIGKLAARHTQVTLLAQQCKCCWLYANLYGAQDELVFDGGSFCCDTNGQLCSQAREHAAHFWRVDFANNNWHNTSLQSALDEDTRIFYALSSATNAYVDANNASGVIIGLSGGIDSALTLAIAVAALGADRVTAVCMPYIYTREMSIEDAREQAKRLAVSYREIPIHTAVAGFAQLLDTTGEKAIMQEESNQQYAQSKVSVTWQNIQSRCRGIILMALSNASGNLVLATGNKSELAMGYATLYGNMVGAYALLQDLDKQRVYRLARWCNRNGEYIIHRIIDREPSAELAPDQLDSDTLPDYQQLDALICDYVEKRLSIKHMKQNFAEETIQRVINVIDANEYKRRQAPLGPKVTNLAFGRDRRMPLTNYWQHS